MIRLLRRVLVPAATLLVLSFGAAAQRDFQASQLHNRPVVDAAGAPVGAIRGFEFDAGSGQLTSMLVALGGARDIAARLPLPSPLPLDATPWVVRQTRKQLLSQGEPPAPPQGVRATSEVMGSELKDATGIVIGQVQDLVFGGDGKLKAVVASFTEAWYPEKGLVAVPWQSFDTSAPQLVAKFSADHIRPAGSKPKPVAPVVPAKPVADVDVRLAKLLGLAVEDAAGKPVGKLEDLVVDASGRRVEALVVVTPSQRVAVPLPVKLTRLDDRVIALESLPANAAPPAAGALLGTQVARAKLKNPNGDVVGSLRDVVVNLGSGQLRYAVASFDPTWVGAGMVVAMALPRVTASGGNVDIPVDRGVLQNGMMLEEKHWSAGTAEQYRDYANKFIKGL
jgi:sporulation protein YlmC with PRC-barrel domain